MSRSPEARAPAVVDVEDRHHGVGQGLRLLGPRAGGLERLLERPHVRVLREGLGDQGLQGGHGPGPRRLLGRRWPRGERRQRREEKTSFEGTSQAHLIADGPTAEACRTDPGRGDRPARTVMRTGTPHPREAGSDAEDGRRGRGRGDDRRTRKLGGPRPAARRGGRRPRSARGRPRSGKRRSPARGPGPRRSSPGPPRARRWEARSTRARRRVPPACAPARSRTVPAARPRGPGRRAPRRASGEQASSRPWKHAGARRSRDRMLSPVRGPAWPPRARHRARRGLVPLPVRRSRCASSRAWARIRGSRSHASKWSRAR